MNFFIYTCFFSALLFSPISAQTSSSNDSGDSKVADQGYLIDKPGTITFTVGVKIKGIVEKPQVMIFLPKEEPWYKDMEFERSFIGNLAEPLPFSPTTD